MFNFYVRESRFTTILFFDLKTCTHTYSNQPAAAAPISPYGVRNSFGVHTSMKFGLFFFKCQLN